MKTALALISEKEKSRIGEYIAVVDRRVMVGSRPGWLDRILGEKDIRRIVIDGVNIDPESEEYQRLCKETYDEFRNNFQDAASLNKALQEIELRYNSILQETEKKEQIKWSEIFTNSLLLGGTLSAVFGRVGQQVFEQSNIDKPNSHHEDRVATRKDHAASSSYLRTAFKNFSYALNKFPYGLLVFTTSKITKLPTKVGTTLTVASSLRTTEAVMIGNRDYQTTVYCGPQIECKNLRDLARTQKVDVNYVLADGTSSALIAAGNGQAEYLRILANNGANLSKASNDGITPVLMAAQNGHNQCLEILIESSADLDQECSSGKTPAFMAIKNGQFESLKLLIKNGANPNKFASGLTLLVTAFVSYMEAPNPNDKARCADIISFLIKNGADPELKTKFGSIYQLAQQEPDLLAEMRKSRAEYLQSQRKAQQTPSPSPQNFSSEPLKAPSTEQEL